MRVNMQFFPIQDEPEGIPEKVILSRLSVFIQRMAANILTAG
jgi:hypothetical protein